MKKLLLILVAASVFSTALPASAGIVGRGVRTHTATTAAWGVSVVNQSGTVINQDYAISFSNTGNISYDYFSLRNTGNLATSTFGVLVLQELIKNKNLSLDCQYS